MTANARGSGEKAIRKNADGDVRSSANRRPDRIGQRANFSGRLACGAAAMESHVSRGVRLSGKAEHRTDRLSVRFESFQKLSALFPGLFIS